MADSEICLKIGSYNVGFSSKIAQVMDNFFLLYQFFELTPSHSFIDFHVSVNKPRGIRSIIRPQCEFRFDSRAPFRPLPLSQAMPSLEWGLNWVFANFCHTHLILHAAVLEKDGTAVILPGNPGSGKSTLCAALAMEGWNLLSDELTIIHMANNHLCYLGRPVNLKNDSIKLIKKHYPTATFSDTFIDTNKGDVALLQPPERNIRNFGDTPKPTHIIFPKYRAGSALEYTVKPGAETLIELARNSFNHSVIGKPAFDYLAGMVTSTKNTSLTYGNLEDSLNGIKKAIE